MTMVVVSYIPLFLPQYDDGGFPKGVFEEITGNVHDSIVFQQISKAMNEVPEPIACIWAKDADHLYPCLLVEGAKKIADHAKIWSESDEDWFRLIVRKQSDHYEVALCPNVVKSIDRFKMNHLAMNGEFLPNETTCHVIFRPLSFHSSNLGMIDKALPRIAAKSKFGLIESNGMTKDDVKLDELPEPIVLGPFEVKDTLESEGSIRGNDG